MDTKISTTGTTLYNEVNENVQVEFDWYICWVLLPELNKWHAYCETCAHNAGISMFNGWLGHSGKEGVA